MSLFVAHRELRELHAYAIEAEMVPCGFGWRIRAHTWLHDYPVLCWDAWDCVFLRAELAHGERVAA